MKHGEADIGAYETKKGTIVHVAYCACGFRHEELCTNRSHTCEGWYKARQSLILHRNASPGAEGREDDDDMRKA